MSIVDELTHKRPGVFCVGDRIRWHAHKNLIANGFPVEGKSSVHEIGMSTTGTIAIVMVSIEQSLTGRGWIGAAWCTHADEPAVLPRTPDKACRWCRGTGSVLLVFSHAPCDCVGGGT